jgi:hypothetical protein
MLETTITYQNGKVFKEIDFQIMLRKEKIKVHQQSIRKSYKLAGIDGPSGNDNMGIDYSRVTSSTPVARIGLDDAIRLADRDHKKIKILENEIDQLRYRKRNLLRVLKSLDGIEEQIFYYRVIMCETQETAAEEIGVSTRHLQRIEKQMKDVAILFEI